MAMERIRVAPVAVLLLLMLAMILAPARLLNPVFAERGLLLEGLEGTVWQGSAARALVPAGGGYLHLGSVRWQLSPWSLFMLAPRVTVSSRWGRQQLSGVIVYRSSDDIRLSDVDATLGASLVRQFVPLELSGDLSLLAQQIELRNGLPYAADGRLVWRDGGWVSPQGRRSLGDYALDFKQPAGESLTGTVVTVGGSLQVQGRILLTGREYDVDLLLSGAGLTDPQLQQALQLIAAPEYGGFRLSLQGLIN